MPGVPPEGTRAGVSGFARPRFWIIVVLGLASVVVGGVLSLGLGTERIAPIDVVHHLLSEPDPSDDTAFQATIVREIRLPRVIVATMVGAALAVAGVLLQGVMRNPLAAPNVVGVTAGAGLAATIVIALGGAAAIYLPPAAFVGALAAGLCVYVLSWVPGAGTTPVRMVLAGVAITAVLTALTSTVMISSNRAQQAALWMAGTLTGASWIELRLIAPYVFVGLLAAVPLVRSLDVLQLGEGSARSLGVRTERARFLAIGLASLLAGAGVAVAGLIGFVGLIVPHVCRLLLGPRHGPLLPAAMVLGAALLVWADLGARIVGDRVPVGVLTALLGGPYFLVLLRRARMIG